MFITITNNIFLFYYYRRSRPQFKSEQWFYTHRNWSDRSHGRVWVLWFVIKKNNKNNNDEISRPDQPTKNKTSSSPSKICLNRDKIKIANPMTVGMKGLDLTLSEIKLQVVITFNQYKIIRYFCWFHSTKRNYVQFSFFVLPTQLCVSNILYILFVKYLVDFCLTENYLTFTLCTYLNVKINQVIFCWLFCNFMNECSNTR